MDEPMRLLPSTGLLLAIALSPTHAETPPLGLQFERHDWALACDNTRTCRAAGYQADEYDADVFPPPVSLLLTREAGPGQPVSAQLTVDPGEDGRMPSALSLHVDDRDLGDLALDRKEAVATLSRAQVEALLPVLRRKSRIAAVGDDGRRWVLSDAGASAVLLKMDEFQGRLETPGALVRKGKRREADVPAATAMPVVRIPPLPRPQRGDAALVPSPALRAALRATPFPEDESCSRLAPDAEDPSPNREAAPLTVVRLAADKLLVSSECWLAAYNAGTGYWVVNDHEPYRPQLVTTSGSDYDKGTIWAAQKGRGIGDCWWTAQWSWNGDRFVQTREATSGLCRGFAGGAWEMPTLVSDVRR